MMNKLARSQKTPSLLKKQASSEGVHYLEYPYQIQSLQRRMMMRKRKMRWRKDLTHISLKKVIIVRLK